MLAWPGRAPASGNMGVNCSVRPYDKAGQDLYEATVSTG